MVVVCEGDLHDIEVVDVHEMCRWVWAAGENAKTDDDDASAVKTTPAAVESGAMVISVLVYKKMYARCCKIVALSVAKHPDFQRTDGSRARQDFRLMSRWFQLEA